MRNLVLALAATLLLTSCLRAQRGTLRGERVIITNQDVTTYPANDLLIRNDSNTPYVYLGLTDSLTPADVGMLRLNGEDFPSGLDAFTEIVGGEIDTNGILVRTTNIGSGQIQFEDTDGSGAFVTLRGFAGSGASYTMNWPGTSYSGACGGTCYIAVNDTTGQMSFTAGSGGGGHPVVDTTSLVEGSVDDTKELRLEVDGLTTSTVRVWTAQDTDLTVAGINVFQTWTATQAMQDINPSVDSTYNIGNAAARYGGIYSDVLHTESVAFRYQGSGATNFSMGTTLPGSDIRLNDSAGNPIMLWDTTRVFTYEDFRPITASTLNLGDAILPWANVYGDNYEVNTAILPDVSAGATVGSASLRFIGHYDDITMYNSPVLGVDSDLAGTIGQSGTLWGGAFLGSLFMGRSGAVSGTIDIYNGTTAGSVDLRAESITATLYLSSDKSIIPRTDNTYSLGIASRTWSNGYFTNLNVSGTCTGCGGGGLPVADTTSVIEGSADDTKELRFEVDGFTTATTRVLTPQDASYILAGTNIAQTFSATQTFQTISFSLDNAFSVGTSTLRPAAMYGYSILLGRSGVANGSVQILNTSGLGGTLGINTNGDFTLSTDIVPVSAGGYSLGTSSLYFFNVYASLFRAISGYIGPSGGGGTSTTLTCGAGQAVKNISVDGGIVTSVSCGAP